MISRESIKTRFKHITSLNEPPRRLSLAFAVGVFIAFSPTFGLHTLSAFAAAWLFELNVAVIIAGTLINNPWTFVFVYGSSICFGSFVLGITAACYPEGFEKEALIGYLKDIPLPFITGTIILGVIAALLSYFIFYAILIRVKSNNRQSQSNA